MLEFLTDLIKGHRENQRVVGEALFDQVEDFTRRHGKQISKDTVKNYLTRVKREGNVNKNSILQELGTSVAVYALIDLLIWAKNKM